jgi:hypothetical protein
MARTRIIRKDGRRTPFFWSDKDGSEKTHKTVYKKTESGVKRMRGVTFDVARNAFRKA